MTRWTLRAGLSERSVISIGSKFALPPSIAFWLQAGLQELAGDFHVDLAPSERTSSGWMLFID